MKMIKLFLKKSALKKKIQISIEIKYRKFWKKFIIEKTALKND